MAEKFSFTRARLEKVAPAPEGKRLYVYDAAEPGLCMMTTSTGSKSFYLYRKVDGIPERIRLGDITDTSVDDARELARQHKGDIARGNNPAEQRRVARGEQTFGEVFTRYIEEYAKVHKRTHEADQAHYDRHLSNWKNRRLSKIRYADVQQLHSETGKTAPYSANRVVALLSKVFSFAVTIGYAGANPCKGIRRFREQSRERFIQPDEMPRFLKALDEYRDPLMADYFRVLLFTGARRSNVAGMAWTDVNFGRRVWTVPGEQSKNGSALQVWLSDQAMAVLQKRWDKRTQDDLYVFPSHGKSGHLEEPKFAWSEILEAAKITDLRIHDLRRTAGSWMAMAGASLPIIGKALGHKSQSTTAIYARLNLDPVAAAMTTAMDAMTAPAPKKSSKRKVG